MKKLYKVGIYCRLSVDDASNCAKAKNYIPADESVSNENQYELLFLDILFAPYDEALQQTPLVLCHFSFYSRIILMTPPLPNLMILDGFGRPVSSWRYPTI